MRGFPVTGLSGVELGTNIRVPGVLWEDFVAFGQNQLSTTATAGTWMVGGTNSATTLIDQMDVVVADGTDVVGAVEIATAATSGDDQYMQLEGAPFLLATGRKMVFETRIRLDTITTTVNVFGMYVPGSVGATTTNPNDTQANGFGFSITNGAISYQIKNATTTLANTSTGAAALTASTTTGWHRFRIYWDGVNALEFWVDGVLYITSRSAAIPLNLYLAPAIGLSTASAVAKTMKVDYVYAAVEAPPNGRPI